MKFKLTEGVVKSAAEYMSVQVKGQLTAKHTRTKIRAEWKKVGSNSWQPVKVLKSKFRGNYVASGNLVNSIKPYSQGLEFGVEMDWYGEGIRLGRQPWQGAKWKGNKGIPVDTIKSWAKLKGFRPRDLKSGQFIQNNEKNRKAMLFMMNRKIKYFGIEPYDFLTMPRRVTLDKFRAKINDAVKQDLINNTKQ